MTTALSYIPIFLDAAHPADTLMLAADALPYVEVAPGVELQLLHVDLRSGLWINRTRLQPGAVVTRHYHPGPVFAVTLQGRWWYAETPDQVNTPGAYLFEPAGSVHTLTVPTDQEGPTVAWFAIHGPNLNLNEDGTVQQVVDAAGILAAYRWLAQQKGLSTEALIVH